MEMTDESIAGQLRSPHGEAGVETGRRMQQTNAEICRHSLQLLSPLTRQHLLETGPGNAAHIPPLLAQTEGLHYTGVEISETMLAEAKKNCADFIANGRARFLRGNGIDLPGADAGFDRVMAVNVIYFWEDALAALREIYRVTKPGGLFCLAFRSRKFMKTLPFSEHGFTLYEAEDAVILLKEAGFRIRETVTETEESPGILGMMLPKDRILVLCEK